MDRGLREKLLAQAHKACHGAQTDYEAVDNYAQRVYAIIQEGYENNYPDTKALVADYKQLLKLKDELFQESIEQMSSFNVLGVINV